MTYNFLNNKNILQNLWNYSILVKMLNTFSLTDEHKLNNESQLIKLTLFIYPFIYLFIYLLIGE